MNSSIESILRQLSITLNTSVTIEEDHAWLVPSETPDLLLTLTWEEEEEVLIYSLSLGEYDEFLPNQLALDLLHANIIMATKCGPKLSYSIRSKMLTVIDSVVVEEGKELNHASYSLELINIGVEIKNKIQDMGFKLNIFKEGA